MAYVVMACSSRKSLRERPVYRRPDRGITTNIVEAQVFLSREAAEGCARVWQRRVSFGVNVTVEEV